MKEELVKDLEGIEELSEVYYDGAGMKLDCDACTFSEGSRCSPLGTCKEGILRFIATRLTELGYVKVVRCGECKFWGYPWTFEYPTEQGWCGLATIPEPISQDHYCGYGEAKEDTNLSSVEEQMCKAKEAKE